MFLLDSRRRKCDALEEMVKSLELKNVEVLCGRGEELGKTRKWNQRFPVIFARAVASLEQLETWTREMRMTDAEIHVFKGGDLKQEFRALHQNQPRVRWSQTLLDFEEFPFLSENQKYIITLNFTSN
jgi:16S rRNA (guanine527-N7)-methyltransferase